MAHNDESQETAHHRSRRMVKSWTHSVSAPPDAVFPLLCPRREYEWIESWECEILYSESGFAEDNCIFKTGSSGSEEIWTVSCYDPQQRRIEFVIVKPDSHVQKLDVRVEHAGDKTSNVYWRRTCTSLTPQGDRSVDGLGGAEFDEMMGLLGRMLEHYCATGEMLHLEGAH